MRNLPNGLGVTRGLAFSSNGLLIEDPRGLSVKYNGSLYDIKGVWRRGGEVMVKLRRYNGETGPSAPAKYVEVIE